MGFTKPLKVFLSYSHSDDPKLFREFRDQLTALEHDDVIDVWSDRDITAGLDWDREINKGLTECDLFIALTSPSFNASSYIHGVEMRTAWDRYAGGLCRIIPIMWRKSRPPDRLRALQFLPGLDHDVASATNWNDILCDIIEQIERVVKEMTEGRWTPHKPVLKPLPAELPYLCDWMEPIAKLDSLRVPAGSARRPGVLILIGTPDDCPEAFLNRTHRAHLPRALDLQGLPVHDVRIMDWPTDPDFASGILHLALEAQPEWEIEKKLPEGLTLLKTTTSRWDAAKEAVLERLLSEWREAAAWALPATRRLLLVISIVSSRRDGALQNQIETLMQRKPGLSATVITIPKIQRDHAVNWASHPQVLSRCHPDRRWELTDGIRQFYERAGHRALPMKPLASELLKLLEQHREKGASA
jgi:hypothetical protein